jgi:hypothetical protein
MNKRDRQRRFERLKAMPCLVCPGCGPTEIHHLNLGGKAGQKRRGDEFTIPLGAWAHRGVIPPGVSGGAMEILYGPSLARGSRRFREAFGTDEELLAKTNKLLEGL